jgi:hypothetical protein
MAAALNIKLSPSKDSRLLFRHLSHSLQQKPNARINMARAKGIQPNRKEES